MYSKVSSKTGFMLSFTIYDDNNKEINPTSTEPPDPFKIKYLCFAFAVVGAIGEQVEFDIRVRNI